eukprot:3478047-Pyramimonas_sp.AAC.1
MAGGSTSLAARARSASWRRASTARPTQGCGTMRPLPLACSTPAIFRALPATSWSPSGPLQVLGR